MKTILLLVLVLSFLLIPTSYPKPAICYTPGLLCQDYHRVVILNDGTTTCVHTTFWRPVKLWERGYDCLR